MAQQVQCNSTDVDGAATRVPVPVVTVGYRGFTPTEGGVTDMIAGGAAAMPESNYTDDGATGAEVAPVNFEGPHELLHASSPLHAE